MEGQVKQRIAALLREAGPIILQAQPVPLPESVRQALRQAVQRKLGKAGSNLLADQRPT